LENICAQAGPTAEAPQLPHAVDARAKCGVIIIKGLVAAMEEKTRRVLGLMPALTCKPPTSLLARSAGSRAVHKRGYEANDMRKIIKRTLMHIKRGGYNVR
jgi:hypothetical protein